MTSLVHALLLLQQAVYTGNTSPPNGDTTGYWQQRVTYTIVAHLDEGLRGVTATGTLRYVNNSPDTLREMFFHQYLNAFRPGSKWSAADERENRVRFQDLREPYYGYERFTRAPIADGAPVRVDYPGAPDSTVVHMRLPHPLPPGDSISISFAWEGRAAIVPRRNGRQGRSYDFAQWYPKVAVYDRGGWEPNALVPAGELYGEFGTYDVTIVARDDQVIAATGVPVSGDPGWARVSKTGAPWIPAPYKSVPEGPVIRTITGERPVRFYAENVHHFAWSASPEYIYEGGVYLKHDTTHRHFRTYDSVAVNVFYKPGDDTTWAGGRALQRTKDALAWLEKIYGPYGYPQISNVHRIDRGGTEFPMMIMDGSASFGLIDHELGHVYTYGMLANNEWRSAWLDEGLTEYQSEWAQQLTPQDRKDPLATFDARTIPAGYRANQQTMSKTDTSDFAQLRIELMKRSEPIGLSSADFREFIIYNDMVYDRASIMYGHLRDLMGDSVFTAFLRDYYDRWAFKHVDERAIRASAERVSGKSLGWFFDQWLRGTGLLNYGVGENTTVAINGGFITRVRVTKLGELRHAMPVGVHTAQGWTIGRADPLKDDQWVDVVTTAMPDSIMLDPLHTTWDWDWRDNTREPWVGTIHAPDMLVDWPFLDHFSRTRTVIAVAPRLWYSGPQGMMIGVGARSSYVGMTDVHSAVIASATRSPGDVSALAWPQVRFRADDVYLSPFMTRPLMGMHVGAAFMDGIMKADLSRRWDLSRFAFANTPKLYVGAGVTMALPLESALLPEQWDDQGVLELQASARLIGPQLADSQSNLAWASGGIGTRGGHGGETGFYGRLLAGFETISYLRPYQLRVRARLNGGIAPLAPRQRAIFASSQDPFESFDNDFFRPRGAALKQPSFTLVPFGGAGLRGFSPLLAFEQMASANLDVDQRLGTWKGDFGTLSFWFGAFGDAGVAAAGQSRIGLADHFLADVGVGFNVRGRFYDRDIDLRIDAPIVVNSPLSPVAANGLPKNGIRWSISW
jgi:hypothetical protein